MTTAREEGKGSASHLGCFLPPGKNRYPFSRRLGGPQGRSGQVRKSRSHRDSIPGSSSRLKVAIPTTLPGPTTLQREKKIWVGQGKNIYCKCISHHRIPTILYIQGGSNMTATDLMCKHIMHPQCCRPPAGNIVGALCHKL